jgi:hypothetical protein
MSDLNDNNKTGKNLTSGLLVVVNRDWRRTYAASIRSVESGVSSKWVATCRLKKEIILSTATDKYDLSLKMDELATIIEDRMSKEVPIGTPRIAGTHYFLN